MTSTPLVSIGLPVYNGERYVRKALESVARQTYSNYELVISDNGSTDRTSEICRQYAAADPRIKYHRFETTVTVIPNFRRVFELSTGEYFMWVSADDRRPPTIVEECVAALEKNPHAVMAHGPVSLALEGREAPLLIANDEPLTFPRAADRVASFTRGHLHNGMVYGLMRRAAMTRAARYRQHVGHDYLLCMQMCLLGEVERVSTPLLTYAHRWGPVDNPMYGREPLTLRDLLVYRGARRRKCWAVLLLGGLYALQLADMPFSERLAGAAAHVGHFVPRYAGHLATEMAFLLTTPLAWAFSPVVPFGRRLKHRFTAKRPVTAA